MDPVIFYILSYFYPSVNYKSRLDKKNKNCSTHSRVEKRREGMKKKNIDKQIIFLLVVKKYHVKKLVSF
jgi:hypothetical protein